MTVEISSYLLGMCHGFAISAIIAWLFLYILKRRVSKVNE